MSIGLGVFLIALGAILSFAVSDSIAGVDLVTIGYICMAAGIVTIILSFILANQRRRGDSPTVERHEYNNRPGDPYGRG